MNKTIALISTNHDWGGSELLWSETALHLHNSGNDVIVGVRKWSLPLPSKIVKLKESVAHFFYDFDSREYIMLEKKSIIKSIINRFLPSSKQFRMTRTRIKNDLFIFNRIKPDIVVFSLGYQWGIDPLMDFCIKNKIKYLLVFHLVNELEYIYEKEFQQKIQLIVSSALKNCFVSKNNAEIFEQRIGLSLRNKEIVFNPNNVLSQSNQLYPLTNPYFHVACVANIMMLHKAQDILFAIFAKEKWKNRNIILHIYGKGIHQQFLEEWIIREKLENIKIEGYAHDIANIWLKNHALILSSRMEGLPLSLVEAMKMKRMAIITAKGDVSMLVEDGVTGFLCQDANAQLFEETMERAWQKRDIWEDLGVNAYNKVSKILPENPVEQFAKIVESFI